MALVLSEPDHITDETPLDAQAADQFTDDTSSDSGGEVCEVCKLFPWLTFGPIPEQIPPKANLICRHRDSALNFVDTLPQQLQTPFKPKSASRSKFNIISGLQLLRSLPSVEPRDTSDGSCPVCSNAYARAPNGSKAVIMPCYNKDVCYCCAIKIFSGFRIGAQIISAGYCPHCRAHHTDEDDRVQDLDTLNIIAQFTLEQGGPLQYSPFRREAWEQLQKFLNHRAHEEREVAQLRALYNPKAMTSKVRKIIDLQQVPSFMAYMEEALDHAVEKWNMDRYDTEREKEVWLSRRGYDPWEYIPLHWHAPSQNGNAGEASADDQTRNQNHRLGDHSIGAPIAGLTDLQHRQQTGVCIHPLSQPRSGGQSQIQLASRNGLIFDQLSHTRAFAQDHSHSAGNIIRDMAVKLGKTKNQNERVSMNLPAA